MMQVESFATTTCRGIDGTWTGAVDISEDGYLYVDDLVRDRKESLSLRRLEGRYQDYLNILVDRKNDGSKELMVGTRWNVADPLGRIEKQYKDNPRYKFRKLPALNEKGESTLIILFTASQRNTTTICATGLIRTSGWLNSCRLHLFVKDYCSRQTD